MENIKFNGWSVYWACLMVVNLLAFAMSAMNNDFFSCFLSGFMLLFCGIAFVDNINKNQDESR
mgnify:CR=1 FL=1